VQRYYELIDVLAYPRLPIRLTELVTPLKPLEAMAQGRMLVASDVGGHRELIATARPDSCSVPATLPLSRQRSKISWSGARCGRKFVCRHAVLSR
jgi:hypothetical protein